MVHRDYVMAGHCRLTVNVRWTGAAETVRRASILVHGVSLFFIILIASLTGLPAHLTRAARVSRVCQVFPPWGNRFPALPPSVLSSVFETDLYPSNFPQYKNAPIGI